MEVFWNVPRTLLLLALMGLVTSCAKSGSSIAVEPSREISIDKSLEAIYRANTDSIKVDFSSLSTNTKLSSIEIYFSQDGTTFDLVQMLSISAGQHTFTAPDVGTQKAQIKAVVYDLSGSPTESKSSFFQILKNVERISGVENPSQMIKAGASGVLSRMGRPVQDGTLLYIPAGSAIYKMNMSNPAAPSISLLAGSPHVSGNHNDFGDKARFSDEIGGMLLDSGYLIVVDTNNHCVRKVHVLTAEVSTLVGTCGISGSASDPNYFSSPKGIAKSGANYYVVDSENFVIRKVSGTTVTSIAGSTELRGANDGAGTSARFNSPTDIVADGSGNLFVADTGNRKIRRVLAASPYTVTTLAGSHISYGSRDGLGAVSTFNQPFSLTLVGTSLYVSDSLSSVIRKIDITDVLNPVVTTVYGSLGVDGHADGSDLTLMFRTPRWLMANGSDLYVSDQSPRLTRIDTGTGSGVTVLAPSSTILQDYWGSVATLSNPTGLGINGTKLAVFNESFTQIKEIDLSTNLLTSLSGKVGAYGALDGDLNTAEYRKVDALARGAGGWFAVDAHAHTLRYIDDAGTATLLAGVAGSAGSLNQAAAGSGAKFNGPRGLVVVGSSIYIADAANSRIRKVTFSDIATPLVGGAPEVSTFVGSTWGHADGDSSTGRFKAPAGITYIATGAHQGFYVTDSTSHTIRKIDISGNVTTVAGVDGQSGSAESDDGTGASARFNTPLGITSDGTSILYVVDSANHRIRKVDLGNSGVVTTLAGSAEGNSNGSFAVATFNSPSQILFEGGVLYVSDTGNSLIRKLDLTSETASTVAGTTRMMGNKNGTTVWQSNRFVDVAVVGTDQYVSGGVSGVIWKISSTGVKTIVAGALDEHGSADGSALSARFRNPTGVLYIAPYLYVVESAPGNCVRRLNLESGEVSTIAGNSGTSGYQDGTGSVVRFNDPSRITTDGKSLYITDTMNHVIRAIDLTSHQTTTLAGVAGAYGSVDGAASLATFDQPSGITYLGSDLYVVERANSLLRKIEFKKTGVTVATVLGVAGQSDHADGNSTEARLAHPTHVTHDGKYLYIVDEANVLRRVNLADATISSYVGNSFESASTDAPVAQARFSQPLSVVYSPMGFFVIDGNGTLVRKIQ